MSEFSVGDILAGKYEIKAVIGTGGMGTVYRARQIDLGRDVAIKVPHPDALKVEGFLARFSREARTVARLLHDNIVQVYEYQESEDSVYIVMEYVEGHDLKSFVQHPPADLTVRDLAVILRSVGEGLAHAHEFGIVHRDIKPHNVMVQRRARGKWRVKIMDFGIAHLEADANLTMNQEQLTVTGQVIGTPSYMAPEQIRGSAVSARSDIYSFGCVTFFCFTRQTPFQGTGFTVAAAHLGEPPPAIRTKVPALTEDFEKTINRCLEKDPENRPSDAADIGQRIYDSLAPIFSRRLEDIWPKAVDQHEGTDVLQPTAPGAAGAPTAAGETAPTLVDRRPGEERQPIPAVRAADTASSAADPTIPYRDPSSTAPLQESDQPRKRSGPPIVLAAGGVFSLLVAGMVIGFVLYSRNGEPTEVAGLNGNREPAANHTEVPPPEGELPIAPEEEEETTEPAEEPEETGTDPEELLVTPTPRPTPTATPEPTPEPTPTPDPVERRVANLRQQFENATSLNDRAQLWSQASRDPQFADDERLIELAHRMARDITLQPEMQPVSGGRFTMGSPGGVGEVEERPQRNVQLDPYHIGRYEVTALEFSTFLNDIAPGEANQLYPADRDSFNIVHDAERGAWRPRAGRHLHPANGISYRAAERYAQWLSDLTGERYRLPTEAEWENAARSGTGNRFPWGSSEPVSRQANYNNPTGGTVPVLEMSGGRTSWDLHHMAGNVSEWCQDWYRESAYEMGSSDNPVVRSRPADELRPRRVLRGGSYLSMSANDIRTARRHRLDPERQEPDVGFRLVRH